MWLICLIICSGEIDIAGQSSLPGPAQELKQMSALGLTGAAAIEDDQARKESLAPNGLLCQSQKVRTIATDDDQSLLASMVESRFIRGRDRQRLLEQSNFVSPMPQQMGRFSRHIMIQKEPHAPGSAICSATSASISVRWSS